MSASPLNQARADLKQRTQTVASAKAALDELLRRAEETAAELETAQANVSAASLAVAKGEAGAIAAFREASSRENELKVISAAFETRALPEQRQILEAAQAAEREATKLIQYLVAEAAGRSADAKLRLVYPQITQMQVTLQDQVREASALVRAANADLPAGATPLPDPEECRDRPRRAREVISEELVQLWAYAHSGEPLDEEAAARVRDKGGDRGSLPARETVHFSRHSADVERRWFKRVTYRPEQSRQQGPRLSNMTAPPPLSVDEGPLAPQVQLVPAAKPES